MSHSLIRFLEVARYNLSKMVIEDKSNLSSDEVFELKCIMDHLESLLGVK